MLPGMELMDCPGLAVSRDVMRHVVRVESSFNPFAIGVVGGRLRRQPRTLSEAVATAHSLDAKGLDFSVGLAQVNRRNLARQGLGTYERAFDACANLQAGARILAECHARAGGDWGKAFSCYYSGDLRTGFRHGYVQRVFASMRGAGSAVAASGRAMQASPPPHPETRSASRTRIARRIERPIERRIERRIATAASHPGVGPIVEVMPASDPVYPQPPAGIAAEPPTSRPGVLTVQPGRAPTPSDSSAGPLASTAPGDPVPGDPAFVF